MYWVSQYRLTGESLTDVEGFWRWLKGWDQAWFQAQQKVMNQPSFPYQSSAYYLNMTGEPILEIWMQVSDFAAMEEARNLSRALAEDQEWRQRIVEFRRYLDLVNTRLVEDVPLYKK